MPSSNIVIVGALTDAHAKAMYDALKQRGHEPFVLNAQEFPEELSVSLGESLHDITIGGRHLGIPAAVYVRSLYQSAAAYGVDADEAMKEDWRRTMLALRERSTLLSSIILRWERAGAAVYNPPTQSVNITKPYQIALLQDAGLPVPASLWSNDPAAVRRFCEQHEAIYKPVSGGAATRRIEPRDLTDDRLAALQSAPVCFQELLPGDDVRVYIIDGRVVCAVRIETDEIDFRQNEKAIVPIELPEKVQHQCIHAAQVLGLRYTGMDLKSDAQGQYKILELNPSAMFLGFESRAGVDIQGPFCEALLGHLSQ